MAELQRVGSARVGKEYFSSKHPGVYLQQTFGLPRAVDFWTGVPVFLGVAPKEGPKGRKPYAVVALSLWAHFEHYVGTPDSECYLGYAVRGFFANGGQRCYVVPLENISLDSLTKGLQAIESLNTIDLVCTPDLIKEETAFDLQQMVVDHCQAMGDRFAILDTRKNETCDDVAEQWSAIDGQNGAIYFPWVKVQAFPGATSGDDSHGDPHSRIAGNGSAATQMVPPCGHIAGVYARSDATRGVHKAPANELLEGVVDLERRLTNADQDILNAARVNCLRAFPGRGIRVWGARTLSGQRAWTYINVRRIFLTAARWMQWNMSDIAFEPNDPQLWARVERELTTYFNDQFLAGALKGRTPEEAFYVRCNAETNSPALTESGQVITEIGLAPTVPYEFVVVRLLHGTQGVSISGPTSPE